MDDARGEVLLYAGDKRAPMSGLGALEQHGPILLRAAAAAPLVIR